MIHAAAILLNLNMINELIKPTFSSVILFILMAVFLLFTPLMPISPLLFIGMACKSYAEINPVTFTVMSLLSLISMMALIDIFILVPLLSFIAPVAPLVFLVIELTAFVVSLPFIYTEIKEISKSVKQSREYYSSNLNSTSAESLVASVTSRALSTVAENLADKCCASSQFGMC